MFNKTCVSTGILSYIKDDIQIVNCQYIWTWNYYWGGRGGGGIWFCGHFDQLLSKGKGQIKVKQL